MVLLVIISGVVVVIGISLAVHGGGMDAAIEMAKTAAWGILGLAGCIVLIFLAGSIASVFSDLLNRWRGSRLTNEERDDASVSGIRSDSFGVFFLIVAAILLIAVPALMGRDDLSADLMLGAAAFAALFAVCKYCDKLAARRRKWREHGRQGHWWTYK